MRGPSTRSVAETVKATTTLEPLVVSLVMFAGTVTAGAVVSLTVIVKDALLTLPTVSVAEQLIVVSPSGNVCPEL